MDEQIRAYVSRYVIPFYFDYENNGYEKIVEKFRNHAAEENQNSAGESNNWIEEGFWEAIQKNAETPEIYAYLLDLLKDDRQPGREANLGTSFVLQPKEGTILQMQYKTWTEEDSFDVSCTDLGVLVFRNGVGFLWYETQFGKELTETEYLRFQHYFIALSRLRISNVIQVRSTGTDSSTGMGMGEWLAQLMKTSELEIRFWAERQSPIAKDPAVPVRIPDKALLFQYVYVAPKKPEERRELAFRLANGYNENFNCPESLETVVYEPFGNICLHLSKVGMAYVASDDETNPNFFEQVFAGNYRRDYFFVYILLLYQSYSCSHYSRLLTKLPADIQGIEGDESHVRKLESLVGQIDLFLVKSVYESVSNIPHQNGAYAYGKKALHVHEDMKSLTAGLNALHELEVNRQRKLAVAMEEEERKQDERKDQAFTTGLALFGALTVFSAAIDAFSLIDWLQEKNMGPFHIGALICIGILTVVMLYYLFRKNFRRKD